MRVCHINFLFFHWTNHLTLSQRAVNQLAEQLDSRVRATAYDRWCSQRCQMLFYDVNDLTYLHLMG